MDSIDCIALYQTIGRCCDLPIDVIVEITSYLTLDVQYSANISSSNSYEALQPVLHDRYSHDDELGQDVLAFQGLGQHMYTGDKTSIADLAATARNHFKDGVVVQPASLESQGLHKFSMTHPNHRHYLQAHKSEPVASKQDDAVILAMYTAINTVPRGCLVPLVPLSHRVWSGDAKLLLRIRGSVIGKDQGWGNTKGRIILTLNRPLSRQQWHYNVVRIGHESVSLDFDVDVVEALNSPTNWYGHSEHYGCTTPVVEEGTYK